MAHPYANLWDDVLGQVRLNHPRLVRSWFRDLDVCRLDRGELAIGASNGAQKRYLDQHCRDAFTEAAQAATGRLVTVTFEADTEQEPPNGSFHGPLGGLDEQLALSEDHTFDHFVTGPCNRLAHAAAIAVAEDPGRSYNPFFVYGPVGLGKTHLLQAICHEVKRRNDDRPFLYLSCETFINHFIDCVEHGGLHLFRYRYRHVAGLVIDDIQFLAERERSQEEFFHTFNALHQSQRQIILSADCSPAEIPSLEERLVSRFNSGLVALLDRPCLETRIAIIRKKSTLRCIEVPESVARFVASRIDTNIRELEGILMKLDALAQTLSGEITLEIAEQALGSSIERPGAIPAILEAVAQRFKVKVSDLQSKNRTKAITHPRHICMYLARKMTGHSLEQVGGYFGGRDHTTVLHASRLIARSLAEDDALRVAIEEITREVRRAS
ncbi:MAG: chromosomal replication initiator protein DnaA [Planctomycetes bacterium]|nr:chromosomal replication initiator protein DnaA [Planctomycetota bacterium]